VAFVCGPLIIAVGAVGILAPPGLVWIAHKFLTSGALAFFIINQNDEAIQIIVANLVVPRRSTQDGKDAKHDLRRSNRVRRWEQLPA
jgi:hypothetical protein